MATASVQRSPQYYARLAGILYLVLFLCGPYSMLYIPAFIVVPGDATATANNLMASGWQFKLGMLGDVAIFSTEIVLSVVFYVLLKPVSQSLALIAMCFRLIQASVQGMNLLNYLTALLLVSGNEYLTAFQPTQIHALVLLTLESHGYGVLIGQFFFGMHLLFLGYLVYRAAYFPAILGIGLVLAGVGYVTECFTLFFAPAYEMLTYPGLAVATLAELALMLWLLIKGVRTRTRA